MNAHGERALEVIRQLNEIGVALSAERDEARLLERILLGALDLTGADGGTLYLHLSGDTGGDRLTFRILVNRSLGLHLGGTSAHPVDLPDIPLCAREDGACAHTVAAWAAREKRTVNIADAYACEEYDFRGTRAFDDRMGYRSTSFLTVPMRDHEGCVIGVLQLINAMRGDTCVPFDQQDELLAESLASQAAIALTQRRLIEGQRHLFESFIKLIADTIDAKSSHTGAHCRRVPALTLMLADAAAAATDGPLASFSMSDDDRYELEIAAWLHDCGKLTTPDHVIDKATKLQAAFDRIELVRTRFEVIRQEMLREGGIHLQRRLAELEDDLAFLETMNLGRESMAPEDQDRVRAIAASRTWKCGDEIRPVLEDDEVENLVVSRGTLTDTERKRINEHIKVTIDMLEALPYPRHLARVPEFAGGHHERMDGKGYPRGLKGHEMPVQARVMAIADVFEALTASDRPYKGPMPVSEALAILRRMAADGHLDPDLVEVFLREGVFRAYAVAHLLPEQDDVPHAGSHSWNSRITPSSRS